MSYEPTVWVDGDHVTSAKLNKLEQGVNSMSYTPTVWSAGDVVTAEKLNKLEQGVAEGGGGSSTIPVITAIGEDVPTSFSCDTSYSDFADLISNSSYGFDEIYPCVIIFESDDSALIGTASMYNSNIEIRTDGGQISYHPDGSITIGN